MFDFLRKAPVEAVPERKASAVGRVIAWGNAGRVAWSPRDTASLTRTAFQGNPVGFRVVRLIAEQLRPRDIVTRKALENAANEFKAKQAIEQQTQRDRAAKAEQEKVRRQELEKDTQPKRLGRDR